MSTAYCADAVAVELRRAGDPARAAEQRAYLKSELDHWGVRVPEIRRIVREALRRRPVDRAGAPHCSHSCPGSGRAPATGID